MNRVNETTGDGRPLSKGEIEWIFERLQRGEPSQDICLDFDRSSGWISRLMRQNGFYYTRATPGDRKRWHRWADLSSEAQARLREEEGLVESGPHIQTPVERAVGKYDERLREMSDLLARATEHIRDLHLLIEAQESEIQKLRLVNDELETQLAYREEESEYEAAYAAMEQLRNVLPSRQLEGK